MAHKKDELNSNWTTPQGLADELGINRARIYDWIYANRIKFKELPVSGKGRKSYLVDRTTRPELRGPGRPW